jgi:protein O-mannosyl-transferase
VNRTSQAMNAHAREGTGITTAIVIGLIAVTAIAYHGTVRNGFVTFDDPKYITANARVQQGLSLSNAGWALTELETDYWHPLTWMSHMMDVSIFDLRAGGHHFVSLILHILNTLLLFGMLRYMTGRIWASAFVAALFALHPLHVESVAWAAERKDVLSTMFWFAALWAYAFYAARPGILRYAAVTGLFALGLMAKPMLVSLPVVLLLLDYWPLERFGFEGWKIRTRSGSVWRLLVEKVPLLLMAAAVAAISIVGQQKVEAMATVEGAGIWMRLTNATVSYGRYIWMMFCPRNLAALYPYPDEPPYAQAAAVLVLLVAVTAAVFVYSRQRRYLLAGWLWYVITLVPVIGIVQVGPQAYADRYTYVPLVGLFVIVTWLAGEAVARRAIKAGHLAVTAALVLAVCGVATSRAVGCWKDDEALYGHAIKVTKDNYCLLANLGMARAAENNIGEAEKLLRESLRIRPDNAQTLCALGAVYSRAGRLEDSLACYQQACLVRPQMIEAQTHAGIVLMQLGRDEDARTYLARAIAINPRAAQPHAQMGMALYRAGRLDEAVTEMRNALELDASSGTTHLNLGIMLSKQGDLPVAAVELAAAARLTGSAQAYVALGNCLSKLGRADEAEKAYRQGLATSADSALLRYNLGVLLAGEGRRQEAIAELRRAVELEPANQTMLEFLRRTEAQNP